MVRLDDLFAVTTGVLSTTLSVRQVFKEGDIQFARPSNRMAGTLAGYVERNTVPAESIYPAETLFVSTNGEGSHSYSYVSVSEFTGNSDVSMLIPKIPMTLAMKLFYAAAITANRPRFSYGRKPKGERLRSIQLPDAIPAWVYSTAIPNITQLGAPAGPPVTLTDTSTWGAFRLDALFDVSYGNKFDLNAQTLDPNGVNFVTRTAKNNGSSARIAAVNGVAASPGGCLTVALGGSPLQTFYQHELFYTGQNMAVLKPKDRVSAEALLFFIQPIEANKYRYAAFGREANRTLFGLSICLPVTPGGAPDYAYMEAYIRGLPMSSTI